MRCWGPHRPEALIHTRMESSHPWKGDDGSYNSFIDWFICVHWVASLRQFEKEIKSYWFIQLIEPFSLHLSYLFLLHSSVFYSRPSSPKSDSELLVRPQESSGPQMQWNWGGFPMVWQHTHTQMCFYCLPRFCCRFWEYHADALFKIALSALHLTAVSIWKDTIGVTTYLPFRQFSFPHH